MSELLAHNLALLRKLQPGFTLVDPLNHVRCDRGAWGLYSDLHPNGLAFHSREPHREADRIAATLLDGGDAEAIVVVGLGLGYLLEALDRRGWTGKVLAFEPIPRTVQPLLERRDWSTWLESDRLRILTWPDFSGGRGCWRWFGDGCTDVPTYVNPSLASLRGEAVTKAKTVFERIRFDAKANADARRQFAPRYLQNTLRNLAYIASESDARVLDGIAAGLPAVVVAAGPSLDRALPMLRELQGSAVIICVDTALRVLVSAGITPHAAVAVDPSESNARHLTDLPDTGGTCLVGEGSLDPVVAPGFRGRTFFLSVSNHHPWPWLQRHGYRAGELRAWGSVLTTAFDLAVRMHCDPIVFVGADLAYTGNRPYARGVVYEDDWRRRANWGEPIEEQWAAALDLQARATETDVNGRDVRTSQHLVAFRDWLAAQIAADSSRRYVNATGGGILRGERIEQCSPDDLLRVIGASRTVPADLIARHHRPIAVPALLDAARELLRALRDGVDAVDSIVGEWQRFAPGLAHEDVVQALSSALESKPAPVEAPTQEAVHGRVVVSETALQLLTNSVPLVPMILPAHRLEKAPSGARLFRFRTLAARLICATIQCPDGSVTEDGTPLRAGYSLDDVPCGTYVMCRDEIHFRASDESDPRMNGRSYAVFVPPCVAALEQVPRQEILDRQL